VSDGRDARAAEAAGAPAVARRRRILAVVAGLAGLSLLALWKVDLAAVAASLAGASPSLLALAVAANLASLAAHAARWRALIRAPGVEVRYRDSFAALLAGFAAGLVLPARGGDVVRAHLLGRRAGLSTGLVVGASVLDHAVGAAVLAGLLAVFLVAAPLPPWAGRGLAALAGLAAAGGAAAWLFRPRHARRAAMGGLVGRLRAGLAAVEEPRALLSAAAWGVVGWMAEGLVALATLAALGLPATAIAAAVAVLAASAAAAVQVTPANAGSFELATAVAVAGVGAPPDAALAFAFAFHLVHVVPVALAGGALLAAQALLPAPGCSRRDAGYGRIRTPRGGTRWRNG
jgi:uncharacterized membrane protein YbhN (UPF0104 family)